MASNRWALLSLVVANLLPLAGVLFWGWRLIDLLTLYWIESAVVGVYTVLKILLAGRSRGPVAVAVVGKLFIIPFFVFHYGLFWLVHGMFLQVLFTGRTMDQALTGIFDNPALSGGLAFFASPLIALAQADHQLWPVIGLLLSHGVSFVTNYIGGGEYRRTAPNEAMGQPYSRVFVLHLVIIGGGFVAMALGQSLPALLLFVGLKVVVDLRAHLREHRKVAPVGEAV